MSTLKYAKTPHDPELSAVIWKSYKPALFEKHGSQGAQGYEGEQAALLFLGQPEYFPDALYAISHEDCLHQLLGIDITVINSDMSSVFIDVKTGASKLYYTLDEGWYLTIQSSQLITHKRTDAYMHIGPKKDVFVYYELNLMKEFLMRKMPKAYNAGDDIVLYRRHWPDFIRSNL